MNRVERSFLKKIPNYSRMGREVKQFTVIGERSIFQFYPISQFHQWKDLQAKTANPYFAKCRSEIRTVFGEETQVILAKRYTVINELVDSVNVNVNSAIKDLQLLYKVSLTAQSDDILTIAKRVERVDGDFARALTLMAENLRRSEWGGNYDFRLDNVLFDSNTNHYILWDVLYN